MAKLLVSKSTWQSVFLYWGGYNSARNHSTTEELHDEMTCHMPSLRVKCKARDERTDQVPILSHLFYSLLMLIPIHWSLEQREKKDYSMSILKCSKGNSFLVSKFSRSLNVGTWFTQRKHIISAKVWNLKCVIKEVIYLKMMSFYFLLGTCWTSEWTVSFKN